MSLCYAGARTNVCMAGPHTDRQKSSKIAPPAADAVVWPRARRTELPKKAPPTADLRGSAGPPEVTHSLTNCKIKLRRPHAAHERTFSHKFKFVKLRATGLNFFAFRPT